MYDLLDNQIQVSNFICGPIMYSIRKLVLKLCGQDRYKKPVQKIISNMACITCISKKLIIKYGCFEAVSNLI